MLNLRLSPRLLAHVLLVAASTAVIQLVPVQVSSDRGDKDADRRATGPQCGTPRRAGVGGVPLAHFRDTGAISVGAGLGRSS